MTAQCRLCVELHNRVTLATVRATVPMAGERPRYGLCDDCLAALSEYVEDVEVVA